MAMLKKILRILRIAILVVLAFVVGAAAVFTLTAKGRENLAGLISSVASTDDQKIRLSGLNGIWSGNLRLDNVVIEDRQGAWLALRGVSVDWSPLALLSRTFRADKIAVERIEVARLPAGGTKKQASSGGLSLPVSVDIKQIDLPEIALGEALAGTGIAELAAKGMVRADRLPLGIETKLNISRSDGKEGVVDADIAFAPADNRIALNIRAAEPAGGIIANILKLPNQPAVELVVSGEGPAANWSGTGTFAVDGKVVTRISGTHQLTDQGNVISAKGDGAFEDFVPAMLKPLLAGSTTFDIAGTRTTTGGVDIERATVASSALTAAAAGSLDPAGAADLSLEVKANGAPIVLSLGSDAQPVTVAINAASLRALGDGKAPAIDFSASLVSIIAGNSELRDIVASAHSDAFDIAGRSGPVAIKLGVAELKTDVATLAPLVAGRVSVDMAGSISKTQIVVDEGTIRSDALNGQMNAKLNLADLALELGLKADVVSSALPAGVRIALAERTQFSATASRDAEGAFAANAIELTSGALKAQGTARVKGTEIDADLKGSFADVSLLSKQAKGAIDFALTAKGARTAPDVSLTVTSDRIEAAAREITGLNLTATGKVDPANPAANIALTGNVAGQPLQGNAVLRTADGKREIKGLSLSLGQNKLSGDLVLDQGFVPLGTITIDMPDIGPIAALALETAEGDVRGKINFTRSGDIPQVTVNANTASLKRGDLAANDVAINADILNYLKAPAISGTIKAKSVTSGKTVISGIAVDLKRDGEWTGFSGGATVADIPAKAAGRVKLAGGVTTIELASGEATMRGIRAALARPTTVSIAGGTTTLDRLALNLGGGTATISGTAGSALNLNATLANVPASLANSFSPGLGAAGSISGTVKVSGAAANPTVGYDLNVSGAATTQTTGAGFGPMKIGSTGTFDGGRLTFQSTIGDGSGLALRGGGTVVTNAPVTLDLNFAGPVPFSFLTRTLAAQGMALTGSADVNVQVRGPATSPVIGGSVRASGARLLMAQSGIAINDINLDVGIAAGVARINRLTGSLSTGGQLTASGTVGTDAATGFPADITVKLTDGRYTDGRVVTANLGGDIAIKGPLTKAPVLSGTINLARTVISIPEKFPGSLTAVDVKHKNAPKAVVAQQEAMRPPTQASGGTGALTLDVTINAPSQIFVQGRGLDAELGGTLRLSGSSAAPQAVGEFTLKRGRLSILGKRLNFTRGSVGFSGSLVPTINFAAETTAGDATVTITVTGEANNPKFSFSSVPALPEDEVLARLIFGRSMSNLSPLQIAQLAEAAAQMAGIGGSTSLLSSLRSTLGVDDLDIRTNDQGDTSIAVGKYLNDRTYLSLEAGDKPGSGKATIDLNVGRGIKLRGQATDAGEAKGGIFYEREY
ncbi:translocation/assembly module TamB domain-containing protein [Aminobacter sp. AP02]|uniref:translocation/assembly module TamB domain-containing protein n=1 Tax=Aminobacter sp. AP02 TaxID=2135737 RepID=UPI000D6A85A4|nr:translocation/assembly module TamB domain-containing protein [Aminobacter sp. AP02]PWK72721.1 autotransporter secretion inner membrane protein TamB [Aminobacter sp. AP02]